MHATPKKIIVEPDSELARLLDEAAEQPLLLEKDGVRYRLDKEEADIWASYDPDAALEGIRAAAGSWKDIEAEALKAYLYRAREAGSRPLNRP